MSDTSPRGPSSAPQLLADALLRSLTGTTVQLRVTNTNVSSSQSEIGLVGTTFAEVSVGPAVMRKLRSSMATERATKVGVIVVDLGRGSASANAALISHPPMSLFDLTLGVTKNFRPRLLDRNLHFK